ncbi:MAG: ATP-binding protein [Polyangiaceae bacterium]
MEARDAGKLMERANRALGLSAFAAAVLVAAAALLWRRAGREDRPAAKLAQSERLASLGTMSAVLAHEIKNPLAALKGNAQLVAESVEEGSRARAQVDRVVEAAVRLQNLVANLLDFARTGELSREEVDPGELVFLAACEAAPGAQLALDGAPATWSLDPVRVGQALENLLRNAEQASPERVSATVTVEGERLVIVIRDEGPGFAGAPEAFFEPFATTKARGTGLGLSVARRVVELHGGALAASNREGGGAEIRVEIPRETANQRNVDIV